MQRQILAALLRSNAGRGQEAERRVIKMRTWKMAGIAALAGAMTIGASQAQQPQSIKLVYLHGALVRTAIILFVASVPVNLVALITKIRKVR